MTLEEKPLYRASEKPGSQGKYETAVVGDVEFVSKGGDRNPHLSVKRRKNAQYVVVEKTPNRNIQHSRSVPAVEQSLEEGGLNFLSFRPEWKYTSKIENGVQNPYVVPDIPEKNGRFLPPIDLGWHADPLIGSLINAQHQPGGGDAKIFSEKFKWNAKSKVGSLDNVDYNRTRTSQSDPTNERFKPFTRYGAMAHMGTPSTVTHYTPGRAEIVRKNTLYKNVGSKVGSLENACHVPGGGDVMIQDRRPRWHHESRIDSLDNVDHRPRGGDTRIPNQRLSWRGRAKVGSLDNIHHQPRGGDNYIPNERLSWRGKAKVGSLENVDHTPRGGNVVIPNRKLRWTAEPKVNSLPYKRGSMEDISDEECY